MFPRAKRRMKDTKDPTGWLSAETIHRPEGPRQRTVCYLARRNILVEARWFVTIPIFVTYGALHWGGAIGEAGL